MPAPAIAADDTALLLDRERCALVLVDYQTRLLPAIDGAEAAVQHALFLAQVAHTLGVPVLGTEQNPQGLGPNDERVRTLCDHTVGKMHFNAAAEGLAQALRAGGRAVSQAVVAGCEAHVCLTQTALGLRQIGLQVFVVPAACGSRRAADKALAMQRLSQHGVTLLAPEMVAFEWLRTCSDARFKQVLQHVKQLPA
jgi:nicotinamidase-related amidase